MATSASADGDELAAGGFAEWLAGMRRALAGEQDAGVPCGGCTACCRSSQFVHIGPDETDTLAHIPARLLFRAPRLPAGHMVLGYDQQGRCPMLGEDGCTIYDHRPRTCRTYDCRVFPATGVEPEPSQPLIAQRSRRWRFELCSAADRDAAAAVRAAAVSLEQAERPPANRTQLAVRAIESAPPVEEED